MTFCMTELAACCLPIPTLPLAVVIGHFYEEDIIRNKSAKSRQMKPDGKNLLAPLYHFETPERC